MLSILHICGSPEYASEKNAINQKPHTSTHTWKPCLGKPEHILLYVIFSYVLRLKKSTKIENINLSLKLIPLIHTRHINIVRIPLSYPRSLLYFFKKAYHVQSSWLSVKTRMGNWGTE